MTLPSWYGVALLFGRRCATPFFMWFLIQLYRTLILSSNLFLQVGGILRRRPRLLSTNYIQGMTPERCNLDTVVSSCASRRQEI